MDNKYYKKLGDSKDEEEKEINYNFIGEEFLIQDQKSVSENLVSNMLKDNKILKTIKTDFSLLMAG